MPSNPKPVRMWGWTNCRGAVLACHKMGGAMSQNYFGGTRIRVTVVPDKKPKKPCNECDGSGLVTICGHDHNPCPGCNRKKPAKKRRAAK